MDEEDMVHVQNGRLLNHKKEQNDAIFSDMDEPRDHHTEWGKTQKNKYHMIYHLHVESEKKKYKWTYSQNRSRVSEVESKLMITRELAGGGIKWETGFDITHSYV